MDFATLKSAIITPIQMIGEMLHLIKTNTVDYYRNSSLVDATKLTRVEPITVVSRDLMNYEHTPEIMQTLLNLFAAYYLQAIALTAQVGNVRVIKILDRLNPDRDSSGYFASLESLTDDRFINPDSYKYRLPRIAHEAAAPDVSVEISNSAGGRSPIIEPANLAVGKLLHVTVNIDDKTMEVPVNVRLAPAVMSNETTEHLLTIKKEDDGFVERYHAWRSGRITLVKDLIFCQDLIDEHRKALINDQQGVYNEIVRRVNNSKKYGLLGQNPSLAISSNIFVMSEEVAKNVERKLGGKLDNPRIREKAFDSTYAMIIVVMDRDWERVTFYHRGIAAATDVSIKDIKAANKSKGPDIGDVLAQLLRGNSPSF